MSPVLLIEFRRRDLKLSQAQLAQITGIGQSIISQIERGRWLPTTDQLERLGHALAKPTNKLLQEVVLNEAGEIVVVLPNNGRVRSESNELAEVAR